MKEWIELGIFVAAVILTGYGGVYFGKAKLFFKELEEFAKAGREALEDDKITKEELKHVVAELLDIVQIFRKK